MPMRNQALGMAIFFAAIAGLLSGAGCANGDELTIVVKEDADGGVTDAAADLAGYLGNVMGAEARIAHEGGAGKVILVGQGAPGVQKTDLPPTGSDIESSRITTPEWKRYAFTIAYVHEDGEGPGKDADIPLDFRHLWFHFYGIKPFELLIDDVKFEPH